MKLILDPHSKHNQKVPTEYTLTSAQDNVSNTFVFSEKDFAGFNGKRQSSVKGEGADRKNGPGGFQNKFDKSRRFQPYYRRAIPSAYFRELNIPRLTLNRTDKACSNHSQ